MKKLLTTFVFTVCICAAVFSQIIVDKGIYKSNFSNVLREPRWVSYYLLKGGGDCQRAGFKFINDDARLVCATDSDYKGKGYDKGHLANAEDFASNCKQEELTFRYYNCLPQTPNLNRGVWKTNETQIRKWSQTQKLYIICGGFFRNKKMGNAAVPDNCWKVVQSVATKKVLYCGWFTNSTKATVDTLTVEELGRRLKTRIVLLK